MVTIHDGIAGQPPPSPSTRRPFSSWSTTTSLWHGLGLFGESYLLFSVGTLRPLWEALYPSCFDDDAYADDNNDDRQCNRHSYQSITYSVVLGVMVGMAVLGILADTIGRRRGSIITAMLMAGGAFCLTFSSVFLSHAPSILFPVLSLSLFVFGIGVGGEYPLSASSASERQMAAAAEERQRRYQRLRLRGMKPAAFEDDNHADKVLTPRQSNTTSRINVNKNNNGDKSEPLILVGGDNTPKATTGKQPSSWQTLQIHQHHTKPKQPQLQDIASFGCETEIVTVPPERSSTPVYISTGKPTDNFFFPTTSSILYDDCNSANSLATNNSSAYICRGREVLLTFSMQGMGIFVNSILLALLLLVARRTAKDEDDDGAKQDRYYYGTFYYDHTTLLNIWRVTYAIGAAILIYVLVSRILWLTESEVWKQEKEKTVERQRREHQHREVSSQFQPPQLPPGKDNKESKKEVKKVDPNNEEPVISPTMSSLTMRSDFHMLGSTNLDGCGFIPADRTMEDCDDEGGGNNGYKWPTPSSHVKLLFRHYGVRLFGTSMTWLLWDVAYYGNKLFQSSILIALMGDNASMVSISSAAAINAFVALLGYYAAAAIVDDPDCGRLTLQQTGLAITGTLFLLCGLFRDRLSSSLLVVMYLGSSFFGQCGPNCTTFLIPAEIFPTNMRTMCHGISASAGKLGALIASILFNFVSDGEFFMISGCSSFVALVITFLTIPDTTTLDLHEIDKQWACIVSRGESKYEGPAIAPDHLSFYERNQNTLCCRKR